MTKLINSSNETNNNQTASGRSSNVPVSENPEHQEQKQGFWNTLKTAFAWGLGGGFGGSIGWAAGQAVARFFGKIFRWIGLGIASWLAMHGIHTFSTDAVQHSKAPQAQVHNNANQGAQK